MLFQFCFQCSSDVKKLGEDPSLLTSSYLIEIHNDAKKIKILLTGTCFCLNIKLVLSQVKG